MLDESTDDCKVFLALGASELIFVVRSGVQVGVEGTKLLEFLFAKIALVRFTIETGRCSDERRSCIVGWYRPCNPLDGKVRDNLRGVDCSSDLTASDAVAP